MENIYTVFKLTDPDGKSYIGSTKNLKKACKPLNIQEMLVIHMIYIVLYTE